MKLRGLLPGVGLVLVLTCWVMSSPPFSAPDEPAHLVRAVSAAAGQLRGQAVPTTGRPSLLTQNKRSFDIPRRFRVADNKPCFAFRPQESAACQPAPTLTEKATRHVGTYFPALYVPLGAAAELSASAVGGVYAARIVSAFMCGLLLLLAYLLAATRWQRVAWLCGAGPLTFFVSASAATNGMEVAGSLCFVASTVALLNRTSRWSSRALWSTWTASGLVLVSVKALGPPFAVFDLMAVVAVLGRHKAKAVLGVEACVAAVPVAVAASLSLVWTATAVDGATQRSASSELRPALSDIGKGLPGLFSQFGWTDVVVPLHLWLLGYLALGVFLTAALVNARPPARRAICLAIAAICLATVAFTAEELAGGFGLQARYVLAIVAPVPLIAAAASTTRSHLLAGTVVILMLAVNGVALIANASRYAVGRSASFRVFSDPPWSPPGGWPWLACAAAAGLAAIGLAALREPFAGPEPARS